MNITRRKFMKATGIGAATFALSNVGFVTGCASTYSKKLKMKGAKEVITVCPYCSVCCHFICHVSGGKVVSTEGDPGYPVSEGALCAKGSAMLSQINDDKSILKRLYRAPNSDKWEVKSWGWMIEKVAQRIKETRDKHFKEKNEAGQTINRVDEIFHLGSSQMDNEELAVTGQAMRTMGVVHIDHQARV
jgi:formate dehydrogenase major subunit